jgi:hypothetical protein
MADPGPATRLYLEFDGQWNLVNSFIEDLNKTQHPIHGRFDPVTEHINFVELMPSKLPVPNYFAFPIYSGLLTGPLYGFSFKGTYSQVVLEPEGPFPGYYVWERVENPWEAIKEPG